MITSEKKDYLVEIMKGNIPENLYITRQTIYSHIVPGIVDIRATNTIEAGYDVNPLLKGNVDIPAGNNIVFVAGNSIVLKPGFIV